MNPSSPQASGDAADTLQALLDARHSCRGYLPREVEPEVLERILGLAQRTASWCNSQPWQLVVTRGAATEAFREALLAHVAAGAPAPDYPFPAQYAGVYQERRRECGWALYDAVGVTRGDREASRQQAMENFRLFGAPHVAIVTSPADLGVYGAVDCGAYVANFLLAAEACGVACIAQAALASHPDFIRRHFGLPQDRLVVCGISFGYADAAHPANRFRTSRAPLEAVVDIRDRAP